MYIALLELCFSQVKQEKLNDNQIRIQTLDFILTKDLNDKILLIGKQYFIDYDQKNKIYYQEPADSVFIKKVNSMYLTEKINDNIYLINPSGGHVFEFNYKTIKRIDNSSDMRAYFSSQSFVYKNEIYLVGGYGFWEFKSQIIKFNLKTKKWQLVDILLDANIGLVDPLISLKGDDLYILSPELKDNFNNVSIANKHCFKYNLLTKTLEKIPFPYNEFSDFFAQSNTNQMYYYEKEGVIGIYNKNPLEAFVEFDLINKNYSYKYLDSRILDSNSKIVNRDDNIFSLTTIKSDTEFSFLVNHNIISTTQMGGYNSIPIINYLLIIIIPLLLIYYLNRFKKKNHFFIVNQSLVRGKQKINLTNEELFFLTMIAKKNKISNNQFLSFLNQGNKSYDHYVKKKNIILEMLESKIYSTFKKKIFKRTVSILDRRSSEYKLEKFILLSKSK